MKNIIDELLLDPKDNPELEQECAAAEREVILSSEAIKRLSLSLLSDMLVINNPARAVKMLVAALSVVYVAGRYSVTRELEKEISE